MGNKPRALRRRTPRKWVAQLALPPGSDRSSGREALRAFAQPTSASTASTCLRPASTCVHGSTLPSLLWTAKCFSPRGPISDPLLFSFMHGSQRHAKNLPMCSTRYDLYKASGVWKSPFMFFWLETAYKAQRIPLALTKTLFGSLLSACQVPGCCAEGKSPS